MSSPADRDSEHKIYTFQGKDEDGQPIEYKCVTSDTDAAAYRASRAGLRNFVLLDISLVPEESIRENVLARILDNPFLGEDWLPILETLEMVFARTFRRNDIITFNVLSERHGGGLENGPYLQGLEEADGSVHFELAGNLVLWPKLTEKDVEGLRFLGWEVPDADTEPSQLQHADFPNPYRRFPVGVGLLEMFAIVFEALTSIYGVTLTDGIYFNQMHDADEAARIKKLFRLYPVEDSQASIFYTLPGILEVRERQLELAIAENAIDNPEARTKQILALIEALREGVEVLWPLEAIVRVAKDPARFVPLIKNLTDLAAGLEK